MKTTTRVVSGRGTRILPSVACLVWLASGVIVHAQSVTATLVGTVTDESGAAVPKAVITVTKTGTEISRNVVTNDRGDFTVANLEPGFYRLVGGRDGFKRTVTEGIELLVNQTARVDLVLHVGAVAESIEVTGATPQWHRKLVL